MDRSPSEPSEYTADSAGGPGLFGLGCHPDRARYVVLPVPFEATTSFRSGTARGPAAVLEASRQVDLLDVEFGEFHHEGIAMLEALPEIATLDDQARRAVARARRGGAEHALEVDRLCERLNEIVRAACEVELARDKCVVTLGGDHASVFGAIRAHAERHPGLGILHVDAHADLREAYEGFTWSHASVFYNVVERLPQVARVVQVGVRDLCREERRRIEDSQGRIQTFFDAEMRREQFEGRPFAEQCARIVDFLPERVYVSFDVDGLDPSLCPHTGTPVPGGLSFAEASHLLGEVVRSGRRIVGADLVEVAPGPEGGAGLDANVGARILLRLFACIHASTRRSGPLPPGR